MINILFVTTGLEKNGTEEFIMNVLRGLNKSRFHADFLLFSQNETSNSKEAESYGCKIFRLPSRRAGIFYYWKLNSFFKEKAGYYNVVHWNEGSMTTIMPIYYAHKYSVPIRIIHAHNSKTPGLLNNIQHFLNKKFSLRYCTHRFACSTLAADFFFDSKDSVVIKNGIVVDNFVFNDTTRRRLRKAIGADDETIIVGHVGRFTKVKNQEFIIKVFIEYSKQVTNSKLILIGNGELYGKIMEITRQLNIKNILFLGQQFNVNEWLQAFDIFIMPSLYEGLPFVLVEAQTADLPCLVSDTINKDVAITKNVTFLPLKDGEHIWCKHLLRMKIKKHRNNLRSLIEESGFSINSTVQYLEGVYNGSIK